LDSSGFEQGPVAGSCEHGDEPSGSIEGGEFLDMLYIMELVKRIKCSFFGTVNPRLKTVST
jgi:hypothetical protein